VAVKLCIPADVLKVARRHARVDRRDLSGYVTRLMERGDDRVRMEATLAAGVGNLVLLDVEVLELAKGQAKKHGVQTVNQYLGRVVRLDADISKHWEGESKRVEEREAAIERQIVGVWA